MRDRSTLAAIRGSLHQADGAAHSDTEDPLARRLSVLPNGDYQDADAKAFENAGANDEGCGSYGADVARPSLKFGVWAYPQACVVNGSKCFATPSSG